MMASLKQTSADACGCSEQRGLSRRTFLKASLAAMAGVAGGSLLDLGGAQVALAEEGYTGDVLVVGGGTILPEEATELEELGVSRVFGVDTPLGEIVDFIRDAVGERRGART